MRWLDRKIRDARFAKARPFVEVGDDVLDVGCSDGDMFRQWDDLIGRGIGIDPDLTATTTIGRHELRPGSFPDGADDVECDVVTILAVLEHVPPDQYEALADACARVLRPGGRVIVTVPSPLVDRILDVLIAVRLIDGMHAEEHHGFVPADTAEIFGGARFELVRHRTFQLRLNNLYVFRRR
jgi:2-polyprenyl-3-methyl-5-hydroxy-6-metoxy-1,4-benzoquinol methylase